MRKKIVKTAYFSPNVEMVYYADGTKGLRSTGGSVAAQDLDSSIPDQGRAGNPIAWQDSMDGEPTSSIEIDQILETLRPNQVSVEKPAQELPKKKGI